MATDHETASLVVRRGARSGRRIKMEAAHFRIGQQEDCDLVLKDAYVSPIHTVLERGPAGWVVRNQGMNGTLVNGQAIEGTHALSAGDMIQVGAETLLEFVVARASRHKRAPRSEAGPGARPWWRHPAAMAGIGIYLAGIVGFFVFLASIDAKRDRGLAFESVGRATEATREFLLSGPLLPAGGGIDALDPAADRSRDFYVLGELREAGRDDEAERVARAILARVEGEFFQAWQYEQRGATGLAIDRYERVIETVPTLRAPVTRLASARIRVLREKNGE